MSCTLRLLLGITVAALIVPCGAAEEKKDDGKKEPPRITGVMPFAVVAGITNKITIRGMNLTNANGIRWLRSPAVSESPVFEFKIRGKAKLLDKADPKKHGDTQLEIELALPENFPGGDLPFIVEVTEGDTNTNLLFVIEKKSWLNEKEPNGAFRKPNSIRFPQTIRGAIQEANDVDVFQFEAKAGQKLRIESLSTHYSSMLDPIVTLYNGAGRTLASSDDVKESRDAQLRFTVPSDGAYLLSIIDAHDRGGVEFGYVLMLNVE